MSRTIIDLGQVREALAQWNMVRRRLASSKAKGFHITILDEDGEHVFAGGAYRDDPQAAVAAILRSTAQRALSQDEPPLFQASKF